MNFVLHYGYKDNRGEITARGYRIVECGRSTEEVEHAIKASMYVYGCDWFGVVDKDDRDEDGCVREFVSHEVNMRARFGRKFFNEIQRTRRVKQN